jgi:RNA polymerase sigma-70 factor (ECF subfamily)
MQSSLSDTDETIVGRILAGNIQQFEVLMKRYSQRLYRVARAILRNDADAEDAVQQAYLNAFRQLARFEGRAQFSTWLTRIVVYEALSKRRRLRAKPSERLDVVHDQSSDGVDPERQAYGVELRALLDAALEKLPDGYRSVFLLREVDGLTTSETADRLALTEGATKARLHRAKGLLQQALKNQTRNGNAAIPVTGGRPWVSHLKLPTILEKPDAQMIAAYATVADLAERDT